MRRRFLLPVVSIVATSLFVVLWRLYSNRSKGRIPSPEGIENPQVTRAFNQVARMPQMRLLRQYTIKQALNLQNQGEAVDLGCGPGYLVIKLAQQAPELNITGVDLSDEMLARAEDSAQRSGVAERVKFRIGDAANIPIDDNSVDLVVSTLSLHHWSNPVDVFNEIGRVLRPGGSYVIFDLRRDMIPPAYLLLWFVTNVVVPAPLKRINEPMGSRDAAYTPKEAGGLAKQSHLSGWRITQGPLWLTIEGTV